jgi:hypothetical protein
MTLGQFKYFDDLYPGQWFLFPNSNGLRIGVAINQGDGVTPVFISENDAASESPAAIAGGAYVPVRVDVHVDTKSLHSAAAGRPGYIAVTPNGSFLEFRHLSYQLLANLNTGFVEEPKGERLFFSGWSLVERRPEGYVSLLDFRS